jgi:DNA-binding CsgD family transcriptional regulator
MCYGEGIEISLRFGDSHKATEYLDKAAQVAAGRAGTVNISKRMVDVDKIRISLVTGDLKGAHDFLCSSLGWHDSGTLNEALLAGAGVLVGMRVGDLALVDALFDPNLLSKAVSKNDAESCGLLLPGFAEVMRAREMEKDLTRLLARCVESWLIDPYTWIQLCAARYGTADCAALASKQIDAYFRDAIAPLAPAHVALFNATMSRRFGKQAAARGFARDAAPRYDQAGWHLSQAMALELAGEERRARAVYATCGATYDVARLDADQTRKHKHAPFGARLTPRELEVTRLVARKWSNSDVARALRISVRTVDHHLEAAFSKIGLHARWQLTEQLLDGLTHE